MNIVFSDLLIKFFEKEEWATNFLDGNLYMNKAKKFITENNNFRGDEYEGCQVTDIKETIYIKIERPSKDEIILPLMPTSMVKQSFQGADNVFCASALNNKIIQEIDKNKYKFNDEYINYMAQFGKYAVVFNKKEFIDKIDFFGKEHNIPFLSGDVEYKPYDERVKKFLTNKEQYEMFFSKYITKERNYDKQNEWRCVLCNTKFIDKEMDHADINIGKFEYARMVPIEILAESLIYIQE